MWGFLLAWVSEVLAPWSRRRDDARPISLILAWFVIFCLLAGLAVRSAPVTIASIAAIAFLLNNVGSAYNELRSAADLPLQDPRQPPGDESCIFVPTALAIHRLAIAIDAARRERFVEASDLLTTIDRELLTPDQIRLLEGVRALVTLALGDRGRAAQQAIAALPTGIEELDERLGRLAVESAWNNAIRLAAIERAWGDAGIPGSGTSALSRLRRLARIRLAPEGSTAPPADPEEARALAHEARAMGDERLARELEATARKTRGYR
jgi:hypothetical protein